jgi:hypothetical protein
MPCIHNTLQRYLPGHLGCHPTHPPFLCVHLTQQLPTQVFNAMEDWGLPRDAITYSAVISALSKGRQWSLGE